MAVEWHQSQSTLPSGFFGPPISGLGDVTVLVGRGRDAETHEIIGPIYIAPLGTSTPDGYPPDGRWVPVNLKRASD